jgi:hypothetical protein
MPVNLSSRRVHASKIRLAIGAEEMRSMGFLRHQIGGARAFALAGATAALLGASLANSPAVAGGDDGYAPIWSGIGGLMGFTSKEKEDPIEYRERARLVLPPKMALAPPPAPNPARAAVWPVDQDLAKARKERAALHDLLKAQSDLQAMRSGDRLPPDKLRADRVVGPKGAKADPCAAQTNTRGCDWIPFRNVFENVGLVKPDELVAGEEPDRDWLTDPPKGYRRATAKTVATFDAKSTVNQSDPRAALYHPPEQ